MRKNGNMASSFCSDGEMEKPFKVPCILHMDSIRGYHRGLSDLFQSYLWEEWKERHNIISEDVHNNFLNVPFITLELPQQENSFDCGLFLLYYVERFLQQAPVNFSPFSDASIFLNKEWFQPAEASSRRGYIKSLIYQIYNENTEKHPTVSDEGSLDSVVEGNVKISTGGSQIYNVKISTGGSQIYNVKISSGGSQISPV